MICGRGPREWASFLFCSAPIDWGARTASACSSPNGRAFFACVRELVQSGALGKIMRFTGTYDQDQLLDESLPITWRHINKLAGCGALGDLGSHLLSISRFIMGDITKVNAVATTVFPKHPKSAGSDEMVDVENEDIMTFMAEYANGAIGQIACSRVATGRKNYLTYEIRGTMGSVRYDLERMGAAWTK